MRKKIAAIIVFIVVLALVFWIVLGKKSIPQDSGEMSISEHIYVSWDTMEFDKCVAAWLIVRFIDEHAQFKLYPQGTEIKEGILFDVPGAPWSRKHQMCTSDCILASHDISDPAVKTIVNMAHQVELNFWKLDQYPDIQKHNLQIRQILDNTADGLQCFRKTREYFDNLYQELRNSQKLDKPKEKDKS